MRQCDFDVILVCQEENIHPKEIDAYHQNIQLEQQILLTALENEGLKVDRVGWDSDFDWSSTRMALIRETWDYYIRIDEFTKWLHQVKDQTQLANPFKTLTWNLDKFYLRDLQQKGINIPETLFIEKGDKSTLNDLQKITGWNEMIIKPAVAGAARDTFRISLETIDEHEEIFQKLVKKEKMLFQRFQSDIIENGERTLVLIDGEYTHSVLKRAKAGDFRVQDDHGGTVHQYTPTMEEIAFAQHSLSKVSPVPFYGRVDIVTDVNGQLALQELELIEPELWFRECEIAAQKLALRLKSYLNSERY